MIFGAPHESLSMRHLTAFNISSADTVSVICDVNSTSTVIWYAIPSLLVIPVWTWHSPLYTLRTMINCKKGFSGRTSCVVGHQSTSDNVITNWYMLVAKWLSWCLHGSRKLIIHMFSRNARGAETLGRHLQVTGPVCWLYISHVLWFSSSLHLVVCRRTYVFLYFFVRVCVCNVQHFVLSCVLTFTVSLLFPHKTMFGSFLPQVVCRRAHLLFTLLVFVLCIVVSNRYWLHE
jgi:hypothetical protein